MESQFSEDFRKKFLFIFTRELINSAGKKEMIKLQSIVEEKRKTEISLQEIPKQPPQVKPQPILRVETPGAQRIIPRRIETQRIAPPTRQIIQKPAMRPTQNRILFIPEPTLPKHLEYLKPTTATEKVEIDLGKLNPLLKDPAVKIIEGSPEERVKVMGAMGTKDTDILLSKEEIEAVINKFSEVSKIPTVEGIYRVVVGNLNLSAIISEVIGSKFVIKKIISPPQMQQNVQIIPKK